MQQVHDICNYSYFINKGLKFQPYICIVSFHDVLIISINLYDIAILNILGMDYHCIINGIGKSRGVNLLHNTDLTQNRKVF